MSQPALIFPLNQLKNDQSQQLGVALNDLIALQRLNLPIVKTFAVPAATLELIAQENHLKENIATVLEMIDVQQTNAFVTASHQIQELVKRQRLPQDISDELLHLYEHELADHPLKISISPLLSLPQIPAPEYVQGEANLLETIRTLWSQVYSPENLSVLIRHSLEHQVAPFSIVIQALPTATRSGYIHTRHPDTGAKHLMQITSGWGLTQHHASPEQLDSFEYDLRSKSLVSRQLGLKPSIPKMSNHQLFHHPSSQADQDQLSLTDDIIHQLALIALKAKHSRLDHLTLEWVADNQPQLVSLSSWQDQPLEQTSTNGRSFKGVPLTSGQTWGVMTSEQKLVKGAVYYLTQLKHDHLPLLEHAAGLLLEQPPTSAMRTILQQRQLPALLIRQPFPFKPGLMVKLDADRGVVELHHHMSTHQDKAKTKQVWALAGNPATAPLTTEQAVDGYYFQFEFLLQQLKVHPQHLSETGNYPQLSAMVQELVQLYLQQQRRPCLLQSLMSHDLKWHQLKHAPTNDGENQWLGEKGASLYLSQPGLLQAELKLFDALQKQWQVPMGWVSGWVRTSSEWHLLQHQLDAFKQQQQSQLQWWLTIDTPSLLLTLPEIAQTAPTGLIFNTTTLHHLLTGLDPTQPEQLNQYVLDQDLFRSLLERLQQRWPGELPQLFLLLDRQPPDLVEQLERYIGGVIVRPSQIAHITFNTSH